MNIKTKFLNQFNFNQLNLAIHEIMQNDQVGFITRMQGWFNTQLKIDVIHHIKRIKKKIQMTTSVDAEK